MASSSRIQLENWLKKIDVVGKVLDIGGSQYPVKNRTKSWNAESYDISDIPKPHEVKKEADFFFNLNERNVFRRSYDVIFCLEVFEYIYNPKEAFSNIKKLLNKGGKAYISFHWSYGLHNPKGEDCLRYSENAIKKLADGFEILKITHRGISKEGKEFLKKFYRAEGMRLDYEDEKTYVEGFLVELKKN